MERVAAALWARGGRPYVIGVGGSGALGAYGQYLAGLELFDQAVTAGLAIDVIVVPSATGGTQAGLIAACADRSPRTRVAGVVVARSASELRPVIASMVRSLDSMAAGGPAASPTADAARGPAASPTAGGGPAASPTAAAAGGPAASPTAGGGPAAASPTANAAPAPDRAIDLDESQLGDGYGRPTLAAAEATELLARTEGILTDPIYTAKALAGLVATVRAGAWDGKRIVFWHAGGLPGIFEPLD